MTTITHITTRDTRFPLQDGAGSDAVHDINVYAYPITELHSEAGLQGSGIVLTLAGGNVVRISPSLNVTRGELDEGLAILEAVLVDAPRKP